MLSTVQIDIYEHLFSSSHPCTNSIISIHKSTTFNFLTLTFQLATTNTTSKKHVCMRIKGWGEDGSSELLEKCRGNQANDSGVEYHFLVIACRRKERNRKTGVQHAILHSTCNTSGWGSLAHGPLKSLQGISRVQSLHTHRLPWKWQVTMTQV